ERGHTLVRAKQLDHVLNGEACLITYREEIADRQRAVVKEQVERERAALADDRNTTVDALGHNLVRPQGHLVEEIDETVAIGTEVGQRARTLNQLRSQAPADIGASLGKTRGKANETTGASACQVSCDLRNLARWCCDKGGIGGAG